MIGYCRNLQNNFIIGARSSYSKATSMSDQLNWNDELGLQIITPSCAFKKIILFVAVSTGHRNINKYFIACNHSFMMEAVFILPIRAITCLVSSEMVIAVWLNNGWACCMLRCSVDSSRTENNIPE